MFFLRERKGKEKQGPPPPREREREERQTRTNNASNLTHRRLRPLRASEQNTSRKASRSRGKSRSRRRSKAQSTTSYVVRCRSKARSTSTNSKQSMTPSKYSTTPKQSSLAAGRHLVFCKAHRLCLFFSPVLPPVLWLVQVAGGGPMAACQPDGCGPRGAAMPPIKPPAV